jgi:hypothetical protein
MIVIVIDVGFFVMQYSVWPHIEHGIKFFITEKIKNILLYLPQRKQCDYYNEAKCYRDFTLVTVILFLISCIL